MTRLAKFLNEAKGDAAISQFKKYSVFCRLFNLMIVLRDTTTLPETGQSFIPQALNDLSDTEVGKTILASNSTAIKTLQTNFNMLIWHFAGEPGKKLTQKDLKEAKNIYFKSLFRLLVPAVEDYAMGGTIDVKSLTTIFNSDAPTFITKQNTNAKVIAKALEHNTELGLTELDITQINTLLRQFIGEELPKSSTVDASNKQIPVENPETQEVATVLNNDPAKEVVNSEMPTYQVKAILKHYDNEMKKAASKGDNKIAILKELNEIRSSLKTNTTADRFFLSDVAPNSEDNEVITTRYNTAIKDLYEQLLVEKNPDGSKAFTLDQANFIGEFIKGTLKGIQNRDDGNWLAGVSTDITLHANAIDEDNGFRLLIKLGRGDKSNPELFWSERVFHEKGLEPKTVENKEIHIPESKQKHGLNKSIFKELLKLYEAYGVKKLKLTANVDVGGYAWFRYGFVPDDIKQVNSISQWMTDISHIVGLAMEYDADLIAKKILDNTEAKTPEVLNFVNLLKEDFYPNITANSQNKKANVKTKSVAITQIFKKCAEEFSKKFADPKLDKMTNKPIGLLNIEKELLPNIGVANFGSTSTPKKGEQKLPEGFTLNIKPTDEVQKPLVKYSNTRFAISYKALLSIQAIKDDDGTKPLPTNGMFGNIHLNWDGHLNMNDIEKTKAYINYYDEYEEQLKKENNG